MFERDLKLQFEGKVVPGAGRGRRIGIPTINIATARDIELAHGIYCCVVEMPPHIGGEYYGAMHFGPRPTFDDPVALCEVHLLDYDGPDLTGEYVRVYVFDYLRPVIKFRDLKELKSYVEADIARVREIVSL